MVEGFAIVCLGVWLQLAYFGLVHISAYRAWPLVLAAVGGVMIRRGIRATGRRFFRAGRGGGPEA